MYKKIATIIIICLGLYSLYLDIELQDPSPTDLRNRIVGARMLKDNLSPYYYHWKNGDQVKYYNYEPPGLQLLKISAATSTPFLHAILSPIADIPQVQLNILWFFF